MQVVNRIGWSELSDTAKEVALTNFMESYKPYYEQLRADDIAESSICSDSTPLRETCLDILNDSDEHAKFYTSGELVLQ